VLGRWLVLNMLRADPKPNWTLMSNNWPGRQQSRGGETDNAKQLAQRAHPKRLSERRERAKIQPTSNNSEVRKTSSSENNWRGKNIVLSLTDVWDGGKCSTRKVFDRETVRQFRVSLGWVLSDNIRVGQLPASRMFHEMRLFRRHAAMWSRV